MERYKVVGGSQSGHCCFECTIVDTTKPVIIGGEQYDGQFEALCETFTIEDAEIIVKSLNSLGEL